MFSLLSRVVREDIEISLEPAPNLWPVIADPAQFEACIVNLATNARDAMPTGGKLTIITGNQHLDAHYAEMNTSVTPGDYTMITVTDTGTGMTQEVIARVFEPFFTTKEPGRGTGLGLSMVFGFVNQSGGHVSIHSEPGFGSTIRLFLPRASDTAEPRVPAGSFSPTAAEEGHGETVLVVEDNAAMRQAVVQQLALLNYRVLESASASAALAILENEKIDLVFSDVVMAGGMDGFDLAERVGGQWPAVRILMTSGFMPGPRRVRPGGRPESLSRFLGKPYDLEQLTRAVRETLDA
jgi:CheY-like chemotaxis protein